MSELSEPLSEPSEPLSEPSEPLSEPFSEPFSEPLSGPPRLPAQGYATTHMLLDQKQVLNDVYERINPFYAESNTSNNLLVIQTTLTSAQRSNVHEYTNSKGLISKSVFIPGSSNKIIEIRRLTLTSKDTIIIQDSKRIDSSIPTEEMIRFFTKVINLSFPCTNPKYFEHYLNTFDPLYGTLEKWKLFVTENNTFLAKCRTFRFETEINNAIRLMCEHITQNTEFQNIMTIRTKPEHPRHVDAKAEHRKYNIYTGYHDNKFFLSLDMKQANITVLRDVCPSIFDDGNAGQLQWHQFVKKFTESDFIRHSKYVREVVIGKSGFCKKAKQLQENKMQNVHNLVMAWIATNSAPIVLCAKDGDELVYELPETYASECLVDDSWIDSLKYAIEPFVNLLHIKVFKLHRIASRDFFVKKITYNTDWVDSKGMLKIEDRPPNTAIEIKCVPKYFLPQVVRWVRGEEIQQNDLVFSHDGYDAKYEHSIFDPMIAPSSEV